MLYIKYVSRIDNSNTQDWHMVTVAEEVQRALQLASVNNGPPPPIIPPGPPSLPPNQSETSGPSMSPDHFGPLQMSPAFSVNSSHSCSKSLAKVKIEAPDVEESRGHQEDAGTGIGLGLGGNSSMVEEKKCLVQLERVAFVLKNTEQVQMRPGHMEEIRTKKIGTPGDLGPKKGKDGPTESPGRVQVKCDECGKYISKSGLLNHKRVVHRGEKPFKCTVGDCDKRFSEKIKLADHRRVTHGFPKLECKVDGCGSEFLLRSAADIHHRAHKIKAECDECGKSMSASHLSIHKKRVHGGNKP